MSKGGKNAPQQAHSYKREGDKNDDIYTLLFAWGIANILHGDYTERKEEDIDDQKDSNSDFSEVLPFRDFSACFVDSACDAENQGNGCW